MDEEDTIREPDMSYNDVLLPDGNNIPLELDNENNELNLAIESSINDLPLIIADSNILLTA